MIFVKRHNISSKGNCYPLDRLDFLYMSLIDLDRLLRHWSDREAGTLDHLYHPESTISFYYQERAGGPHFGAYDTRTRNPSKDI